MRKEIGQSKFGFCAGGITTYEFAHMKTPFAMICQYKHQLIAAREWKKLGLALNLGLLSKSTPIKIQNIIKESNARIVTVNKEFFVLEKSGRRSEIELLHRELSAFGILQFTRSGRIAVTKTPMEITKMLEAFQH